MNQLRCEDLEKIKSTKYLDGNWLILDCVCDKFY